MKKVLLIDDDVSFRTLLMEVLREHGWNVLEAGDGESGLEQALEHKPSVVICDLLMPRCNGFQFCRALNSRRAELPNTKIVVSSGSGYAIDRINALESGADEFVTKPIRADDLLALLERLSGGGASEREPVGMLRSDGATRLKFWGVRGSIPSPGPDTVYYGGNTSCIEIRAENELIILDAGTGIRPLGQQLQKEIRDEPIRLAILVSHTHWDHIQGFPFFAPAYDPRNQVRILAFEGPRQGLKATLASQMESPYFPISMREMPGHIEFEELKSMDFNIGKVRVKAAFMNHPGVCVGYRIFTSSGSIAYCPDNELFGRMQKDSGESANDEIAGKEQFALAQDQKLEEFVRGADVLIADAQYDASEYSRHAGWGHSCVEDVVNLAIRAGVKRLFLFHHDPDHSDDHVAQMLGAARKQAAAQRSSLLIEAAREGAEVVLEARSSAPI